ncbi:MAG: formyltetrahydrofolate deformylase [Betaproteobacteria bacterium]
MQRRVAGTQVTHHATGLFFMRVQFSCGQVTHEDLQVQLKLFAEPYSMQWTLNPADQAMRTVLFVSKEGHCLNDLLFRWKSGSLAADIPAIVSNHETHRSLAESYGIPFHHLPLPAAGGSAAAPSREAAKRAQEREIEALVERERIDLVVLARYMQILSPELCTALAGRAINIHHSFLPSFKGARPYFQAHARGVKLIGATAHYVTADLDEGPIIEQDVQRVDHTMSAEDFTAAGRDIECMVLARAVRWHLEHRVLVDGRKCVVFR